MKISDILKQYPNLSQIDAPRPSSMQTPKPIKNTAISRVGKGVYSDTKQRGHHSRCTHKPPYAHIVARMNTDTAQASKGENNAQFSIHGSRAGYKQNYSSRKVRQRFAKADLSRLPAPVDFYFNQGLTLKGGGVWRSALCPFHQDKNPSLSINTEHGGYICHVCNAHGDMVGFYMALYGVDFVQACKDLDLYDQ